MSRENVEIIRVGYDYFGETGDFRTDVMDPEFVWDMSTFRNWPPLLAGPLAREERVAADQAVLRVAEGMRHLSLKHSGHVSPVR
jgi:hypothetical protein